MLELLLYHAASLYITFPPYGFALLGNTQRTYEKKNEAKYEKLPHPEAAEFEGLCPKPMPSLPERLR